MIELFFCRIWSDNGSRRLPSGCFCALTLRDLKKQWYLQFSVPVNVWIPLSSNICSAPPIWCSCSPYTWITLKWTEKPPNRLNLRHHTLKSWHYFLFHATWKVPFSYLSISRSAYFFGITWETSTFNSTGDHWNHCVIVRILDIHSLSKGEMWST